MILALRVVGIAFGLAGAVASFAALVCVLWLMAQMFRGSA